MDYVEWKKINKILVKESRTFIQFTKDNIEPRLFRKTYVE